MIRLNLLGRHLLPRVRSLGLWITLALGLLLFVQMLELGWSMYRIARHREHITALETHRRALEGRLANGPTQEEHARVAGALAARNQWFRARKRSPVRRIAALESGFPIGKLNLTTLEARPGHVVLSFLAPDVETPIRWLTSAFSGGNTRLNVEERHNDRLRISFAWSE
jgi:hypothetical protein